MELKNKKFIIILSVAVLSAILIACGVYFFNNKQQAAVAEAEVAVEGNSTAVVEPEPEVVEEAVDADDAEPAVVDDAVPEVAEPEVVEEEVAEEAAVEESATTVEQQLVADELPAEPAAPEGDGFIPDEEDGVLVDPSYIFGEDNSIAEADAEVAIEDYEEPELADDSDFGPPVPMKDEAPPQLVADAEVEKIENVDEVVVDDAEAEA